MNSYLINLIGLILDILGVLVLFKYGLPSEVTKDGHVGYTASQSDPIERAKWYKYNRMAKVGLGLLIAGFVLQAASDIIPMLK